MSRRKPDPGPSLFGDDPQPASTAIAVAVAAARERDRLKLPHVLDLVDWPSYVVIDERRIRHKDTGQSPLEEICSAPAGDGSYWRALDYGFDRDTANLMLLAEDGISLDKHKAAVVVRRAMIERIGKVAS